MAGSSTVRKGQGYRVRDGRLFGPFTSKGIPLRAVHDAVEWIAWSADADGRFRSGEMKKDLGIPQSHVATILGALSSIGAVELASRRMGYAATDDDPDGWVGALTAALAPAAARVQSAAELPKSRPCAEPEPVDGVRDASGEPDHDTELAHDPAAGQGAAEPSDSEPCDEPGPVDTWDESGISCYEPRVADLAAAMRPDSRGRDIAFRCWIGEVRAYLFLRPEGDGMRLLGMAKQLTPSHAGGPAWFEGSYDGHGIGFDDEGKLRRFSSARKRGLVIRGPFRKEATATSRAPQPVS